MDRPLHLDSHGSLGCNSSHRDPMMRARYLLNTAAVLISLFAANVVSAAQAETSGTSVLRPGDHIRITVLSDDKDLSGEFEVAPDGTLKHPLYNQVNVTGVPVADLKQRIASFLRKFQREPQLEVEPLFKVTIGGEVKAPGIYYLAPETTIADAIAKAGGATDRGNLDQVGVSRDGRKESLKLANSSSGHEAQTIQSGDQITVAPQRSVMASISPFVGIGVSLASLAVLIISHR